MNKDFKICILSDKFYRDYPIEKYPELEQKSGRPFLIMLVMILDKLFAIPFRTNIKHKYAYIFKESNRMTYNKTGLDYTKAVLIEKLSYLGRTAIVDNKEFQELNKHFYEIQLGFKRYLLKYYKQKKFVNLEKDYSTLQYFHLDNDFFEDLDDLMKGSKALKDFHNNDKKNNL